MKQSEWNLVHWPIRPEDKLPPERKVVLVFVEGSALPYCAYIRYAAGDKTCPYFVVYRADKGADVWAWCDCLPKGPDHTKAEFYNHNFEGRGFPKRDSDDFHDYFPTQESGVSSTLIDVKAVVNTLNHYAHEKSTSWHHPEDTDVVYSSRAMGAKKLGLGEAYLIASDYASKGAAPLAGLGKTGGYPAPPNIYDSIAEVLNQHSHRGGKCWMWNPQVMEFTNEHKGQSLVFESASLIVRGYGAPPSEAAPTVSTKHAEAFAETANKNNCSKPPCCGTQPCIFPDPFAKNPEPFGEGDAPQDPLPTSPPGGSEQVGPAILHQRVIENLKRAHSAITQLNDGFSGSLGRKVRMQLDPMAEDIEHCLNVVQSFRIEELRVSE